MSEHETLRDTFAAAALAGLLGNQDDLSGDGMRRRGRRCYQWADAMLRERARNGAPAGCETVADRDAAPAARAEVAPGTGHTTREPVAWAALTADGSGVLQAFCTKVGAAAWKRQLVREKRAGKKRVGTIVPLYRDPPPPSLTDAEREAVEWCVQMAVLHATECDEEIAALRDLLDRLGGDRCHE